MQTTRPGLRKLKIAVAGAGVIGRRHIELIRESETCELSVISDPPARQLDHFASVIRGESRPLVNGSDGLRTLRATLAIHAAANTKSPSSGEAGAFVGRKSRTFPTPEASVVGAGLKPAPTRPPDSPEQPKGATR